MIAALDLFGTSALPGLATQDDLISADEESMLIEQIDAQGLSPFRFQGWLGKRLTRSFGWSYDFDTGRFAPADPIPDWLEQFKQRAAAFAGLPPEDIAQALLIRYDPGAGIGWATRPRRSSALGLRCEPIQDGTIRPIVAMTTRSEIEKV